MHTPAPRPAALSRFGGAAGDSIDSSETTVWGLGIVQHIDAAAMELFLSYRRYSLRSAAPPAMAASSTARVDFNDFDVVMGGARIKF